MKNEGLLFLLSQQMREGTHSYKLGYHDRGATALVKVGEERQECSLRKFNVSRNLDQVKDGSHIKNIQMGDFSDP